MKVNSSNGLVIGYPRKSRFTIRLTENQRVKKSKEGLQDDYVKFIRFAQWKIDQAGEGVLGFITNHSYLDNSTFRGMRQSLMKSFDEIYILDLHGNSRKKKKCPDGSKKRRKCLWYSTRGSVLPFLLKGRIKRSSCKVFHSETWDWENKNTAGSWRMILTPPNGKGYLQNQNFISLFPEMKAFEGVRKLSKDNWYFHSKIAWELLRQGITL